MDRGDGWPVFFVPGSVKSRKWLRSIGVHLPFIIQHLTCSRLMCCDPGDRSNIAILTASKSVFGRSSSQDLVRVYVDVELSEGQRTREDQVVSRGRSRRPASRQPEQDRSRPDCCSWRHPDTRMVIVPSLDAALVVLTRTSILTLCEPDYTRIPFPQGCRRRLCQILTGPRGSRGVGMV